MIDFNKAELRSLNNLTSNWRCGATMHRDTTIYSDSAAVLVIGHPDGRRWSISDEGTINKLTK